MVTEEFIRYSTEILYHFNCDRCRQWWSIGDAQMSERTRMTCPFCSAVLRIKPIND